MSTEVDGQNSARSVHWWGYALLALGVSAFLLPWMRLASRIGDEAISLEGARRVLEGQLPGRDFFEAVGPGEFYWQALFFKLFGTNIAVSRGVLLITGTALVLLIYYLSVRVKANGLLCAAIFAVAGITEFPVSSYHWDAELFGLLAFVFFIEWQRKSRTSMLLFSAGFAGVTTLAMQQKGVLLAGALLLSAYIVQRPLWRRAAVPFAATYSAPLLAMLCFYTVHGAVGDLLWANLRWPMRYYVGLSRCPYGMSLQPYLHGIVLSMENFMQPLAASVLAGFIGSPMWIFVLLPGLLSCSVLLLGKEAFSRELVPFWLCGGALWISEFQRPDYIHLVWGCPIWLVLLSALLRRKRVCRQVIMPIFGVCCALLGFIGFVHALGASVKLPSRNGTLYGYQSDEALQFLQQHTERGEDVFVYPYYAMYNFLSDTNNPTRYTYLLHGLHTTDQFQEAAGDLERKRVRLVLWDTHFTSKILRQMYPAYKEPQSSDLILEKYLSSHYRQIGVMNGFRVMERDDRESRHQ